MTTIDGDKKNIDGEVFNNPFQLPATRNRGRVHNDEGGCVVVVVVMVTILQMISEFSLQVSKTEGCQWKVMAGQPLDHKGIEQFL